MANDPYQRQVKEVMTTDVVYVDPRDKLDEALTLLVENRVSGVPVVDGRRRCVGVLSITDLMDLARELDEEVSDLVRLSEVTRGWLVEKLTERGFGSQQVGEAMTTDVVAVGPEVPLAHAARTMIRNRVHRLVVTDEDNRLLGIVSAMDLLEAFAGHAR